MVTTVGRKSSAALAATPFQLPSARLKPPAELTGEARQAFPDIVTAARPQHFEPLDMPMLCAFARAVAMERVASAAIMSDMPTSAAMLEVYRTATRTMQALSIRLRIGPQSRAGHTNPRSRTRDDAPVSYATGCDWSVAMRKVDRDAFRRAITMMQADPEHAYRS